MKKYTGTLLIAGIILCFILGSISAGKVKTKPRLIDSISVVKDSLNIKIYIYGK